MGKGHSPRLINTDKFFFSIKQLTSALKPLKKAHQVVNFKQTYKPPVSIFNILSRNSMYVQASQVMPVVKNPPANAGDIRDTGLIPGLERHSGVGISSGVAPYFSILVRRIF